MSKIKVHPSIYSAIEVRFSDFNHHMFSFDSSEERIKAIDEHIKHLEGEKQEIIKRAEWRKNENEILKKWLDDHEPDDSQSSNPRDLSASAVNNAVKPNPEP